MSPGFDVNELGFQRNSDWLLLAGTWKYQAFTPGRLLRDWSVGSSDLGLGWTWAGEPRARVIDAYGTLDTSGYWSAKLAARRELPALSTERLRGGPALRLPPRDTFSLSLASDQRKASYATLDASVALEPASGSRSLSVTPLLNIRGSERLQGSVGPTYETDTVGWQYVGQPRSNDGAPATSSPACARRRCRSPSAATSPSHPGWRSRPTCSPSAAPAATTATSAWRRRATRGRSAASPPSRPAPPGSPRPTPGGAR